MASLKRVVGLPGAVLLGLGSIVGTGVFVSLGIAAGVTGPSLILALALAGVLAGLNGVSSAQLAAAFPVSGGTYEYANRTVGPRTGFTAGWMFLSAKSASAATAALGFAGYALAALGLDPGYRIPLAILAVTLITGLVLVGLRRSNIVNTVLVGFTLATLFLLAAVSVPFVEPSNFLPAFQDGAFGVLHATALLFVAYTGYGRIATLGEEVVDPKKTIPQAIFVTLAVVLLLYGAVGVAAVGVLGADGLANATSDKAAPLAILAERVAGLMGSRVLAVAAVTAMAGVLLNLVLGLSRVVLAMGRRGDAPGVFASVNAAGTTPVPAVIAVGVLIGGLCLLGDVRTTWSFSAFTVLVYYALTNLAALRLAPEHRRFPQWLSVLGLLGCLSLTVWIEPKYWAVGLGLVAVGHLLRALKR